MNKINPNVNVLILLLAIIFSSCQNDAYFEPELEPANYSFVIPNKISFDFSQQSRNSNSRIPYSNSLKLWNISDSAFTAEFVLLAFKSDDQNYSNLSFIKSGSILSLNSNDSQTDIALQETNVLFSDNNIIASVVNFNTPISDHKLNGLYNGELNIYTVDNVFIKSITCSGFIDYQGKFNFFIHDADEDNIVVMQGNINSDNLISGIILKRDGTTLSQITNIEGDILILIDSNLSGQVKFTENSDERILQFNLTHQN